MSRVDLLALRLAIEASWDRETAYLGALVPGSPAYGQCYPTARVVQHFFPEAEVVEGTVWTGLDLHKHFWNLVAHEGVPFHVDLSWGQFPLGSSVRTSVIRDRATLGDSKETLRRVELLLRRVKARLSESYPTTERTTRRDMRDAHRSMPSRGPA